MKLTSETITPIQAAIEALKLYKNEDKELARRTAVSSLIDDLEAEYINKVSDTQKVDSSIYKVDGWDYQKKEVAFNVFGVQMIEKGKLAGTALYCTMPRARIIRDVLNAEYARLKADFEAKILPYQVY